MPRLSIEATELKHTDVNFVSLVKHGANRIPFRIVKEDKEAMLDLGKISRSLFRKAEGPPAVVAVLVSKDADHAKVEAALSEAGLVVAQKSETDDAVVYAQPDAQPGGRDGTLRLNDDVALVVGGLADLPSRVQKEFCSYAVDSDKFMENLNANGFFPSMMLATDALVGTVMNIMKDAEDPGAAASAIGAAIDDFKSYVLPTVSGIPVRAFKADVAVRKATEVVIVGIKPDAGLALTKPGNQTTQSGSGLGAGANANGTAFDPEADKVRATKAEAPIGVQRQAEPSPVNANQGRADSSMPNGGEAPIGVQRTAEPQAVEGSQGRTTTDATPRGEAPIGTGVVPERSPVLDAQRTETVTVAGMMKEFTEAMNASVASFRAEVLSGLTAVQKDVTGMATRLEGVEARTQKAEEAISGTALGDAAGDPPGRPSRTTKSEGPPPLLDTAYHRAA